jgi:hypothetical protein
MRSHVTRGFGQCCTYKPRRPQPEAGDARDRRPRAAGLPDQGRRQDDGRRPVRSDHDAPRAQLGAQVLAEGRRAGHPSGRRDPSRPGQLRRRRPAGHRAQPKAAAGEKATLGGDGLAVAPASAPAEVQQVIAAANAIVGKPYRYGGGHGNWEDSGYDCSGSESYALHGANLIDRPMDSTEFMSFGDAGQGTWITSYANSGHSFLVVAGLRFDTGWNDSNSSGPKWSAQMRPSDGYTVRHPEGL